jgi:AraC-like DNA-binding protein
MKEIFRIESISQFHQLIGLEPPAHPLISLIHENRPQNEIQLDERLLKMRFSSAMYAISYKDGISGAIGYGRNSYDYHDGTLIFMGPDQVFAPPTPEEIAAEQNNKGWTLLFHPDLIRRSTLGENIDQYSFFSYAVNEALHLSVKEREFVFEIVNQIRTEYNQNLDKHSQRLIISNLELFLNYCTRFYDRQFYTRTNFNKDTVALFEKELKDYFNSEKPLKNGIPAVNHFGEALNTSATYLSDLLKKETGKGIKEHINETIINKAKTILLSSNLSIGEIAFELGFEYPQSFSRLFKNKTGLSPKEYRSLN